MDKRNSEVLSFRSEARQLLDIVIHSLYSNKEIFLRELISNSSDALDKRRFEALTRKELAPEGEYEIRIELNPENRTLAVWDNGIGMTRKEAVENLGTIARSGTKEFVETLGKAAGAGKGSGANGETKDGVMEELIGRFGVGFYSCFMVAEKVEVLTRKAGEVDATIWESTGDGTFKVSSGFRGEAGTTVTVYLAPADEEKGMDDFCQEHVVRRIVKRYSDFVTYPIKLKTWKKPDEDGGEKGSDKEESVIVGADGKKKKTEEKEQLVDSEGRVLVWETLNTRKAIWNRAKEDVSDEEYNEFYRHVSHDWSEPLTKVLIKAEGNFEFSALVFIPKNPPLNLQNYGEPYGLQLYVNRVMIKSQAEELLPRYMRFLKGVVDSPDLPLNVSREMLQDDGRVRMIRKRIVRKVLDELAEMKKEDREKYVEFWAGFGSTLKEGLAEDVANRDRIKSLLLFPSSEKDGELVFLEEYAERMPEGQESIYYITGDSLDRLQSSPHLEIFKAKGIEVLYLTDPIDEIIVESISDFEGKKLKSAAQSGVDLSDVKISSGEKSGEQDDLSEDDSDDKSTDAKEKKEKKEKKENDLKVKEEAFKPLMEKLRSILQDKVKDVSSSSRLTSSPACLVGGEGDLSPRLIKLLKQSGQPVPPSKRILELNLKHPLIKQLKKVHDRDPDSQVLENHAHLLHGQSLLAEGVTPEDMAHFSKRLAELMVQGLKSEED